MIRTIFYGVVLNGATPTLVPVTSPTDVSNVNLNTGFSVNAAIPVQYPYSLGVELSAGSTGSGTLVYSISSFNNPSVWVDVQPIAIAGGTFADGTRGLFVYDLPTGAAKCKITWTPTTASTGTAKILLRITPQG